MSKLEIIVMSHMVNEIIKFPDRTIEGVLGSPTAYSSVALGMLGAKVGVVSKIGTDVGEDFLQPLKEANVDIRGIFMPLSTGSTLYVGGSGPGNYSTIQEAINNANYENGLRIYVRNEFILKIYWLKQII